VVPFQTEHFDCWLALFTETVDELFAGPVADLEKARAATMARALARLLDGEAAPASTPVEVSWPQRPGA
jgi:hemoglobin